MNPQEGGFLRDLGLLSTLAVIAPGAFWFGPGLTFAFVLFIWGMTADVLNHPQQVAEVAGVSVLLFGMLQPPLVKVLGTGHRMIAVPFLALAEGIAWGCEWLHRQSQSGIRALHAPGGRVQAAPAPAIFEVGANFVALAFTAVIVPADYRIGRLLFAALFGTRIKPADIGGLDDTGGLLFAVIYLTVGFVGLELWLHISRVPFGLLLQPVEDRLKQITIVAASLAVVLALSSQAWLQLQLADPVPELASTIAVYAFRSSLGLLLLYCTTMVSWALVVSFPAVGSALLLLITTVLWVAWWAPYISVMGINADQHFQAAIVRFIGYPWVAVKNWLGSFPWVGRWLHIAEFREVELEDIGKNLRPPLEGKLWSSWTEFLKGPNAHTPTNNGSGAVVH